MLARAINRGTGHYRALVAGVNESNGTYGASWCALSYSILNTNRDMNLAMTHLANNNIILILIMVN